MWYEQLGFEENPFNDNEETELIGYEDLIDDMLYTINSGNIMFIEGKSGSGKTAILKKAINKFKGHGKLIFLDCNKIADLNIETTLMNKYGFWGRLFNKMPKDMIILFDEIQSLSPKNYERIKYFYDQNYIHSIIFTGTDYSKLNFTPSMRDRISKISKVKQISEDEAIDLVESRLKDNNIFTEEQIKNIFKRSDKTPKLFLQNIEKICEKVVNENRKEAAKEDLNSVLGEEKKLEKPKKIPKKKKEQKQEKIKKPEKELEKKEIIQNPETDENKEQPEEKKPEEGIKVVYEDIAEKYY